MQWITVAMVALPFLTASLLFISRFRREAVVSSLAIGTVALNSVLWLAMVFLWAKGSFAPVDLSYGSLFTYGDYTFDLSFQVDVITVVYAGLVAFITGIVVKYSQYYMHRESGYTRFFINILIFLGGINLLSFAGTLDLLFAGWEMVGISSFLLIAFYRERLNPSRNALRTYAVYRFCDVGLLLGAWLSHLVWNASPTFSDLGSDPLLLVLRQAGEWPLLGLSLLMLLAAAGKSAQFPFTFWIPRAMEGPTPSSAIFYGALSIHAGVFLLMRMFPVWQSSLYAPYLVGSLGLLTAILSTLVGHTQSNIKGQIAYASSAQAGLMFVELALGWQSLALFHMAGNALLRCFQLLVSPSIMAFVLRWQGEGGGRIGLLNLSLDRLVSRRWAATLYVFCLNEAYLEHLARTLFWRPVRGVGEAIAALASKPGTIVGLLVVLGVGMSVSATSFREWAAGVLVAMAVGLSSFALASRGRPARAWDAAALAGAAMGASISLLDPEGAIGMVFVVLSNAVGWAMGRYALMRFEKLFPGGTLKQYHGLVRRDSSAGTLLFWGFLLIAGFPIGTGFLGADLLLHSTVRIGLWATVILALVFVFVGLALVRLFVRVGFAGSHREPLKWNWESSQPFIRRG
jgi:NADH-quinone oxidoreductase subunit L